MIKRSVATDALETLGTVPIPKGSGRDAIHLAVEPVIAAEDLTPGQHVGLLGDGRAGPSTNPVGIVDPFLNEEVEEGQKFWLVVYPRQITSLRHVWTHPAFEVVSEPEITEEQREMARHVTERLTNTGEYWLRDFCAKNDCPGYESIMEAIKNGGSSLAEGEDGYGYGITITGNYIHVSGNDAHGEIPPEFWDHVEAVTGKSHPSVLRSSPAPADCSTWNNPKQKRIM